MTQIQQNEDIDIGRHGPISSYLPTPSSGKGNGQ